MPTWLVLGVVATVAIFVLVLRPRILLAPIVLAFAVWTWVKTLLSFPMIVKDWILADTIAKQAQGLSLHAQAAASLWAANSEFRPAAREIFGRVAAGYGIRPPTADDERASAPVDFGAAARNAAAGAVNATAGKPPVKLAEAKPVEHTK